MGSNLSRQSERKEERREDFAVYDAQNYRKLCEKYMLVNYIEIHFGLNVGKPRENFSRRAIISGFTWKLSRNFQIVRLYRSWGCRSPTVGHCRFSRNSSDSCWEHWIKFILVWVWVKSLNGGMSNASRFMTQDVFRVTEAVVVKQSWSSLTTNFSRPYMTTINHLVWSFRSFQRVILVCQAYYACPRWNNFKRLL